MSAYSTGELAKLCGVSVRTIQFYDAKDLLKPTALTEGGRRLYSEDDLKKLRLICLLKSLGLSLDSVKGILQSENQNKVLLLLLDEQEKLLDDEIEEKRKQKQAIGVVRENLRTVKSVSVSSMSDIEKSVAGKRKLKRTYAAMLIVGIPLDIAEIGTLVNGFLTGIWWPFAVSLIAGVIAACPLVAMYYRNAAYLCPECGTKFKPAFWNFMFSKHTPKTRRLRCTNCGYEGYCIETYADEPAIGKSMG